MAWSYQSKIKDEFHNIQISQSSTHLNNEYHFLI